MNVVALVIMNGRQNGDKRGVRVLNRNLLVIAARSVVENSHIGIKSVSVPAENNDWVINVQINEEIDWSKCEVSE